MPESERRIVVVDDDEIKRYTVSRLLEKAGFALGNEHLTVCPTLERALAEARARVGGETSEKGP